MTTFLAFPDRPALSFQLDAHIFKIAVPPVRMEISSSIAFLRSPKPGAFTAAHRRVPLSLLTTRVARASPSRSSEMIKEVYPSRHLFQIGSRSFMVEIFFS